MPNLSEKDRLLADLLIRQGILPEDRVQEGIRTLNRMMETGVDPPPSLGDVLIGEGILSPEAFDHTWKQLQEVHDERASREIPEDVARAALDPVNNFGRYVRVDILGEGGMGQVCRAWDRELQRWVALKFLTSVGGNDIERFLREARTAAKLNHPNIGAVYDTGEHSGHPFIAMQLVDGTTLDKLRGVPPRQIVEIMRDAARAVQHAHDQGVIHRDIKPQNLMVDRSGRVFVMDFGLAKQTEVESSLSQTGAVMGTPQYMPPEQARGEVHRVDARSDVYSTGATLYELLGGQPPFAGGAIYELLVRVVNDEPKPVRNLNGALSRDLETIVMKCLEKDPDRRYADAGELADDLTRYLDGEAIHAHPPSAFYRFRKFAVRRKGILSVAAAGVVVLSILAWTLPRWKAAERETEQVRTYSEVERELAVLRMAFYRQDHRLDENEVAKYTGLIRRVRDHMKKTGDDPDGHYLIGRCSEVLGDIRNAAASYATALRLNPDHARTLVSSGRLTIERALTKKVFSIAGAQPADGVMKEAEEALEGIRRGVDLSRNPNSMELDLSRGYLKLLDLWRTREYYDSKPMLKKWDGEPFVEEFLLLEAITRHDMEKLRLFKRVTERVPSSYKALFHLGATLMHTSAQGALAVFDQALRINPRFAPALHARGYVRMQLKQFDEAIADFTQAIDLDPDFWMAMNDRGVCRKKMGDLEGAIADFDALLATRPGVIMVRANRANALSGLGRHEEALDEYDRIVADDPKNGEMVYSRGQIRKRLRDPAGALKDFERATELHPRFGPAWEARGDLLKDRKELESARDSYDRALQLNPRDPGLYNKRGIVNRELKDYPKALRDYDEAIRLKKDYVIVWYNRGNLYQLANRAEEAVTNYSQALTLDPGLDLARRERAYMYAVLRKHDKAAEDYDAFLAKAPDDAEAWSNYGVVLGRLGKTAESRKAMDRAVNLEPSNPKHYLNRGIAYGDQKKYNEAIEDFSRAIRLSPRMGVLY